MPKAPPERECEAQGCFKPARYSYSLRFWPPGTPVAYRCRCCAMTLACDIVACETHWPMLAANQVLNERTRANIIQRATADHMAVPDFDHAEPEWLSIDDQPANYATLPDARMHAPAQAIPR
jgi:hypothetical protein